MNAMQALFAHRSQIGLFGNHIDVATGRWTAQDAGIGSGIDSYFEYLVKGSILFQRPELMEMFYEAKKGIDRFLKRDSWYLWVSMTKGTVTIPVFQSLEAFWPGVLSLIGETSSAMKTLHNYHLVWLQYGFTPEIYNIPNTDVSTNRENYPLRPELIESVMYLYRATGDPYLIQIGVDILRSLQHSAKTPCGYATIKDVRDHRKEDRMESFFLAETTKYLYLLFDTDNFMHNQGQHGTVINTPNGECIIEAGGYVFNTEAHPIDPSALHCCHDVPKQKLFDFSQLNTMKNVFKGESIKNINVYEKYKHKNERNQEENVEKFSDLHNLSEENYENEEENHLNESEENDEEMHEDGTMEITTELSMKLDDNNSYNLKSSQEIKGTAVVEEITDVNLNNTSENVETEKMTVPEPPPNSTYYQRKFDPQAILERIRSQARYPLNKTWESNYKVLSCKAQPFIEKMSIFGEFFNR